MRSFTIAFLLLAAALPSLARNIQEQDGRVRLVPSADGLNACTLRITVDREAELLMRGDFLQLRTFNGDAAVDLGSECNVPLGRGIIEFKWFKADGRGSVWLAEEPSARNGWRAVFGVRDDKPGTGDYTIEFKWRESIGQERKIVDAWGSDLRDSATFNEAPWTGAYRWSPVESTGKGGLRICGKARDSIVRVAATERGREILDLMLRGESGRQYWVRSRLVEWGDNRIEADLLEFDGAPAEGRMKLFTAQDGNWVERVDLDGRVHGDKLKVEFRR